MSLTQFAHAAGRSFAASLSRDEQKAMGQFMTPLAIAQYMAKRLVSSVDNTYIRLLEPSAGAGILAAAVVEELLAKENPPRSLEVVVCEMDVRLYATLEALGEKMAHACEQAGVAFKFELQAGDFLLSDIALSGKAIDGLVIIANPPYFKIAKNDPRAVAHSYAVHGQPNIYGLFMAACARLVGAGDKWCFIVPRSWMNGAYFGAVRRTLFDHLRPDSLHAFESRKAHFEEDAILQEAVIMWATGRVNVDPTLHVLVTRSKGISDLADSEIQALALARLVGNDFDQTVALPGDHADPFEAWTATLETYGLKVSTGPVVAFRAAEHIRQLGERGTVPLLWMQHIRHNSVRWPIQKKREHIHADATAAWMLVPNIPMVLMRRFSPKEDERRVTAAGYIGHLPGAVIGLENHLNYVYRPGGQMSENEVRGLAAFLNSRLVDTHFRASAGSTQVNAKELRRLKLPPLQNLVAIGRALHNNATLEQADDAVDRLLITGFAEAATN